MYFPQEEYEDRWQRVYAEMEARGLDAAVIWSRSGGTYDRAADSLYLVNYYSTASGQGYELEDEFIPGEDYPRVGGAFSAVVMAHGEKPELIMDMPVYDMSLLPTDRVVGRSDVPRGVSEVLKRRGITGRVALVGSDFLPVKYARYLEGLTPQIDWVPQDQLVREVRLIKSRRELDCFRHAGKIVTRALNRLMEGLIACQSEAEAAAGAAYEVTKAGGRFHMIPVSHGDKIEFFSDYPSVGYSEERPKPGDLVAGWVYGPIYQGYWLDPGRTAVAGGQPTEAQRELIDQAATIIEELIDAVRPGVRVADLVELGERLNEQSGGEKDQAAELFPIFGHGNGLFFERPSMRIGQPTDEVFQANMVLGIEHFMSRAGVGSARFEQNFIVHADYNEVLTTSPMRWW